jgi:hypothetical protein|nr:MAG TPA: hypothetical protein [Bacteriophage sp.]
MIEVTEKETMEEATAVIIEKPYILRPIEADDLDYLAGIIDKIGIDKIAECFDKKEINKLIDKKEDSEDLIKEVGIDLMVKIASIIVKNYRVAKSDIYSLLASVSGLTVDNIAHLKLPVYVQMIIDVFKQDGFIDSFRVASSLLG